MTVSVADYAMWVTLCVLILTCAQTQSKDDSFRTVTIEQGPVKGYRAPEGDLFVFYNIPYATVPSGENRFKAPLPAPVWMTPLEAVDKGILCPQDINFLQGVGNKTMQEDCLIANIYVPDTEEKNLPVVFYVHGGGFQVGFGNMVTPKFMVRSKKVIYVNFNYRLGAHGFLCLGTPDAPGNAGMKDQVAALRWVHRNIAKFGGNPADITLQGSSAGSSAVHLLLLSKTIRGLFRRVIIESGVSVASWSIQMDPIANAKEYAKKHIFQNVNDIYALEEFYKTAPFDLITKDAMLRISNEDNNYLFVPCVERYIGTEVFLNDNPVNILKKGNYDKVPMLYGLNNMEGLHRITYNYSTFRDGMNKKFSDFLPRDLQFKNDTEKELIANIVKEFYFGVKQVGAETILGYINYYTDIGYAYPALRALKLQLHAGNDKVYLYLFSFPMVLPLIPDGAQSVEGANHGSQSIAVFDGIACEEINSSEEKLSVDMRTVKNVTRQFWLNFMTTGSPVAEGSVFSAWPPANDTGVPYMEITVSPQLRTTRRPMNRMRFWEAVYNLYYRPPVPPPAFYDASSTKSQKYGQS